MSSTDQTFAEFFDDDYLYFYGPILDGLRAEQEAGIIGRLLKLEAGMSVLDVGCGHGRIALALALRGHDVTGLDASAPFLEVARRRAAEQRVPVRFVEGDMRRLPWRSEFDRAVSFFSAFGYFSDADNQRMLEAVHASLVPGGAFLIDIKHWDRIQREFEPVDVIEREEDFILDKQWYDPHTGRQHTHRSIVRDGRVRRLTFSMRRYSYPELRHNLLRAGFRSVEGYDETGEVLSNDSHRLLCVATK